MVAWISDRITRTRKVIGDGSTSFQTFFSRRCILAILKDATITVGIGFGMAIVAHWVLGEEYASRQQAKILAPMAGYLYGTSHRDEITVMLIDEASLEKEGLTWPAPFAYEARLLRSIGRHKPAAVFLDIYFKDSRKASDIAQMVDEICKLKKNGVDVYLGATQDKNMRFTVRPELENAKDCFKKVSLYFSPDEIDKTAWSYPISHHKQAEGGGPVVNTAAVEIYNKIKNTTLAPKASQSNLALTWGTIEAKRGIALTEAVEGKDSTDLYCRSDQRWRELIPGGFRAYGIDDHEKPICVFHETLVAQELATTSPEEEARVDQRIRGKTVMLGVSLPESPDHVQTPLHGRIPGVYLHAMALDNLLTYGANYPEVVSLHLTADASHGKLLLFLVMSIFIIAALKPASVKTGEVLQTWSISLIKWIWIPLGWHNPLGKKWRFPKTRFCAMKVVEKLSSLLLATIKTGIVAILGTLVFHIGFISTFGVAIFIVAAEWLEIQDKLAKWLKAQDKQSKNLTPEGSTDSPTSPTNKG